jgi:uncharacterized protein YhfF
MLLPEYLDRFWTLARRERASLDLSRFYEAFAFGDSEPVANALAALVLAGAKRATASLAWTFEHHGKPLPKPGDLSIVTSWSKEPLCIIETVQVDIVPFNSVAADFARAEGEDDGSLQSWRRNHAAYFDRECARIGRAPMPDMPVVCEHFRVVYQPGDSHG